CKIVYFLKFFLGPLHAILLTACLLIPTALAYNRSFSLSGFRKILKHVQYNLLRLLI
ncbi:hypothetical protein C0J52_04479, partial [Blattella germanica]